MSNSNPPRLPAGRQPEQTKELSKSKLKLPLKFSFFAFMTNTEPVLLGKMYNITRIVQYV